MTVANIRVSISKKCNNPNLVICAACRYKASIKIKLAIKHAKLAYVGVPDVFTESGKASDVKAKYGLNVNNIVEKVESVMK